MSVKKSRFVLATQQTSALAVVAAVAVSAAGVGQLRIVPPAPGVRPLAAGLSASPGAGSLVSASVVEPTVRTVPLGGGTVLPGRTRTQSDSAAAPPQAIRVVSPVEPTTGFATVGVTWRAGLDLSAGNVTVALRTRQDGAWSPWQTMDQDAEHGPDPGSEEARAASGRVLRDGTDAVAVGRVDDVQVRALSDTGSVPAGLSLAIVDPGEDNAPTYQRPALGAEPAASSADPAAAAAAGARLAAGTMPVAPEPQIFSRAQWGADERLRDKGSLRYGEIHAGFIHHTVNANDYSRADVPAILRGIYAYHTQSRGWSDIGYNFLVDRFGRIWEGRYGGVDRPVVGAHTLGYNDDSFAMSAIGNFEEARPSRAMVDAYAALFAWKLSLAGIDAASTHQFVTSRYFQAINGHRDAGQTACPGKYLYARIPEIRTLASAIQHGTPPAPPSTPSSPSTPSRTLSSNLSGSRWPDLVVRDSTTHHAFVVRTAGQVSFQSGDTAATGWGAKDLVAAVGDLDGDGVGDVIARDADTKQARLYRGDGDGGFQAPSDYGWFSSSDQLTGVGDFDGDGHGDVVARRGSDKALMLYRGRGNGSFAKPTRIARDWSGYDLTTGVDDFDGDGHVDLVARAGGRLSLVRGTGTRLLSPVPMPGRHWGRFDVLAGRGDASGDGVPDLVARTAGRGRTFVYPGNGAGGLSPRIGGFDGYAGLTSLALGGQLASGARPDLVGVDAAGDVRVFPNSGGRNVGGVVDTGVVLDGVDLVLDVGDWNGDGRGDIMTRTTSGVLQLRAGAPGATFAAPVTAGTRFGSVSMLAPVGDVTGDGHPDLAGRDSRGAQRVYPGDGSTGFEPSVATGVSLTGSAQVGLGLWDRDTTPDTAVRRAGSLWLQPGSGGAAQRLGGGLRRYDWLLGLGDVDGDGRADVVARARRSGDLWLLRGRRGGLDAPRRIATGFQGYDLAG